MLLAVIPLEAFSNTTVLQKLKLKTMEMCWDGKYISSVFSRDVRSLTSLQVFYIKMFRNTSEINGNATLSL